MTVTRENGARAAVHGAAPDAEMQVLLCVARTALSPVQQNRLRELVRGPLDWEKLYTMARRHKLAPLLYWHLRELSQDVPPESMATLSRYFLANSALVLELTRELLFIVRALEEEGIPCIPYKGPALAAEAYGNIALRQAGDLDVVVRRRDLSRVRELLRSRGYVPEHQLTGAGDELMVRSLYHEAFKRSDTCTVEVHWAFTDKNLAFSLNLDVLEKRLVTISVGGEKVRSFSREDLLLVLCVHGAKHRWCVLEWITGVAELLRAPAALDWSVLLDRATELGSRRILFLGLRMAHDLMDAPLPPNIQRLVLQDPVITGLALEARSLAFTTSDLWKQMPLAPRDIFYLQLSDRLRDQLRFLLHRLTTPSQAKSWRGLRLGRYYLPLHVVLRPLRSWRTLAPTLRWYFSSRRHR